MLRNVDVVYLILAFLTNTISVAMLVLASSNIGFSVFSFGVLLVGVLHIITGSLCFVAGRKGLKSISETNVDIPNSITCICYIVGQLVVSVAVITLSILGAVFSIIPRAACAGADVKFNSRSNNQVKEIDVRQFCEPHGEANSVLTFIGRGLCILILVLRIYEITWSCCYGTVFGWRRYGGRLIYA